MNMIFSFVRYGSGVLLFFLCFCGTLSAQHTAWPKATTEAKPATRWWWMGNAVDKANLTNNLEAYAKAGLGTMEITPIYGVQGNEANEISFLSPKWMDMLQYTEKEATRLSMQIDMNTGTGWPFGGPQVSIDDAACKLFINEYTLKKGERLTEKIEVNDPKQRSYAHLNRLMAFSDRDKCLDLTGRVKNGVLKWKAPKGNWHLIAAFCGKTLQKVKRSAPGGEGYVMDHFSAKAVSDYLNRFDQAFERDKSVPVPHNFFNDSYEVYKADWTNGLFEQFALRRGYKLEEHLPEFLSKVRTDATCRIVSDYRETLAELLQENFTRQWTDWAHRHGSLTRNQAHGSPGNLIDLYATVDIPECEGFGLTDFGIKGLRQDSLTRPNFSDFSMLKYASSAAHITGKPFTSAESFTWLTEHFRASLSQCKPDMDLMFVSGVNHMFFHGTAYSPVDAAWPGWKFYASIDMSPTNSIWRDAPAFFNYITRCQSFLQMGKPDNDFLIYLPIYDMWQEQDGRLLLFDIHKMGERAPRFIETVRRINDAGYDVDYISDRFIRSAACVDGQIVTPGGNSYKALVIPGARLMLTDVLEKLKSLADEGATIVFLDHYPLDVPGYAGLQERRVAFQKAFAAIKDYQGKGRVLLGTDYSKILASTAVVPEAMKATFGLSCIRRSNPDGYHYFISALKGSGVEAWVPLAVHARSAMLYNPMYGTSGKAQLRQKNGRTEVFIQLCSGESVILKTFTQADVAVPDYNYWMPAESHAKADKVVKKELASSPLSLDKWGFHFVEATPAVANVPDSVSLGSWTDLSFGGSKTTMGTACYATRLNIDNPSGYGQWMLSLGDVRESARVRVNGKEVATLFAVPYQCLVGKYLHAGVNTIELEVTNLSANRIADMDRRGVKWRIFKDANIVDLKYKKTLYANWEPVPSGLLGPVKLIPMEPLKMKE